MPTAPVVAFYGDSITEGYSASSPAARWSTLLCVEQGWTEVNPSVPGLGFLARRTGRDLPGQIIAAHPDVVISTLGYNDLPLVTTAPAELRLQIFADFDRMRAALPETTFVIFQPFFRAATPDSRVAKIAGWLQAAANRIGAHYLTGPADWLIGHPDWTADDLHPNDLGNRAYARLMSHALAGIGLG